MSSKFNIKISGIPLWDPDIGSPFTLLKEHGLLTKLSRFQRRIDGKPPIISLTWHTLRKKKKTCFIVGFTAG